MKPWMKYDEKCERIINEKQFGFSLRYLEVVSFVVYAHFCVVSHLYIVIVINLVVEWIRIKQSFDTATQLIQYELQI